MSQNKVIRDTLCFVTQPSVQPLLGMFCKMVAEQVASALKPLASPRHMVQPTMSMLKLMLLVIIIEEMAHDF